MDTAITIDLSKPKGNLANMIRLTASHLRGYLVKHPFMVEGGGNGRDKKWYKRRVSMQYDESKKQVRYVLTYSEMDASERDIHVYRRWQE